MNATTTASFVPSALPAAPSFSAQTVPVAPAARRSLLRAVRHQASLLGTLTLLGSSAAYCVYALGSIAR